MSTKTNLQKYEHWITWGGLGIMLLPNALDSQSTVTPGMEAFDIGGPYIAITSAVGLIIYLFGLGIMSRNAKALRTMYIIIGATVGLTLIGLSLLFSTLFMPTTYTSGGFALIFGIIAISAPLFGFGFIAELIVVTVIAFTTRRKMLQKPTDA